MGSKNIISESIKWEKLNGDNWDIWQRKIQYILEEQYALETLSMVMAEPEAGNSTHHRRDQKAYMVWKKKNSIARIILLSNMVDDLMCEFDKYETAQAMWIALKDKFGSTSSSNLKRLGIKFDTYKLRPNTLMRQHLREMANMIKEMKEAGYVLSDEQQVQAVIRSLPSSWEYMKVYLIHNENIINFNDVARHLELEDIRMLMVKFDTYKMRPNTPMRQQLQEMANMIRELKEAGHVLSDEQQVQAIVKSLPSSWEQMKVTLTHHENITNFNDVARHLELEDERLKAYKSFEQACYYEEASPSHFKSKFNKGKQDGPKPKKGKKQFKKGNKGEKKKVHLSKVKCFSCKRIGHFARDCLE